MAVLATLADPGRSLCWVAPVAEESELAAEDPLALDYIAQQVGLLLLPALTTRSTRAQAFAMVLYGLWLAERAITTYEAPATDEVRRVLFERWERFWALATVESRDGALPRGDGDSMRGVRGALAAWRPGNGALPLDFPLIDVVSLSRVLADAVLAGDHERTETISRAMRSLTVPLLAVK